MVILVAALLGVALGAYQARKRQGTGKDIAQYAVAFGIAFALLGFILAVILDRTVL